MSITKPQNNLLRKIFSTYQSFEYLNDELKKNLESLIFLLKDISPEQGLKSSELFNLNKYVFDCYEKIEIIENLNKIQSENLFSTNQNTDLREIIYKIIDHYDSLVKVKNIKIDVELNGSVQIGLDENVLKFILCSVISNSIHHSNKFDVIKIMCKDHQEFCEFCVIDEGVGIYPSQVQSIFEDKRSDVEEIIRLGKSNSSLKICKMLIEKFNGDLIIGSKIGEGSRISVMFPKVII